MKTVSVSELKAQLSRYLREVRRGGEVQILDRGIPVARLVPLRPTSGSHEDDQRERLIAAGILRPGVGGTLETLEVPPLELPIGLLGALEEERKDRL